MGSAWLCYFNLSLFLLAAGTGRGLICPFDSIYQFGDSYSDTGNSIRLPSMDPNLASGNPPYGETFPGTPTGRWSDGRLIIDFIARDLGLPLLNPYLQQNASFIKGVNFAVGGATALDLSFLSARGVPVSNLTTVPLSGQLRWFRTYLRSIGSTPAERSNKLKNALFIVGDIGKNDIIDAVGKISTQEIQAYIPFISEAVANAAREIIRLGGRRIIVPGAAPVGCLPINLNSLPDGDKDYLGCSSSLNNLTIYFNNLLQQALASLRNEFPQAVIIYADNYNAFEMLLQSGPFPGFSRSSPLKACCGIGGIYNFDINRPCGSPGVPVCPNPNQYILWDGVHLTEAAYRLMSEFLLPDILAALQCLYQGRAQHIYLEGAKI